ncbi:putative phosphoribosyltransferase [Kribbella amoyensis]|uniref:Putative phosphoribosyltransferase n=1 Tax=Kribbella amoyensis TaxID=996641 RepID=A0A561BPR2_9ACTN|nr:phosphoribosyltransferase family protein [Kribbella amoyensis]TWD80846.1 putative phosphoribosyltransferase [Kribbella amoyensis]
MRRPYHDRTAAGRALAEHVAKVVDDDDVLVLGLARGGVPVAAPVAAALGGQLDVLIVRKLGLPGQPELAMGAIAGPGTEVQVIRNESVLARVSESAFEEVRHREEAELRLRETRYREGRAAAPIQGRTVVLVDDGLATGSTMRAAIQAVRRERPARVVVAVPVGGARTCRRLAAEVDDVVCAWIPDHFSAVGQAYRDFAPVPGDAVRAILAAHHGSTA